MASQTSFGRTCFIFFFQNLADAVRKIAEFLEMDTSSEVTEQIAENCSFDKLKAANSTVKKRSESMAKRMNKDSTTDEKPTAPPDIYRKGTTFEHILFYNSR